VPVPLTLIFLFILITFATVSLHAPLVLYLIALCCWAVIGQCHARAYYCSLLYSLMYVTNQNTNFWLLCTCVCARKREPTKMAHLRITVPVYNQIMKQR